MDKNSKQGGVKPIGEVNAIDRMCDKAHDLRDLAADVEALAEIRMDQLLGAEAVEDVPTGRVPEHTGAVPIVTEAIDLAYKSLCGIRQQLERM